VFSSLKNFEEISLAKKQKGLTFDEITKTAGRHHSLGHSGPNGASTLSKEEAEKAVSVLGSGEGGGFGGRRSNALAAGRGRFRRRCPAVYFPVTSTGQTVANSASRRTLIQS
jgi:hypothetical protein